MAESNNELAWESDNVFVPKYVPKNLKWFEREFQTQLILLLLNSVVVVKFCCTIGTCF